MKGLSREALLDEYVTKKKVERMKAQSVMWVKEREEYFKDMKKWKDVVWNSNLGVFVKAGIYE